MINIILKNRNLIKLYKYSEKTFKFLNKHLYLISIISFITRMRKSSYYKVVSWILKIVVVINLIVTTGLFLSLTDLVTPYNTIKNIYSDLLDPYINITKTFYEELSNKFNDSSINKHLNASSKVSVDSEPILYNNKILEILESDDKVEFKFNIKDFCFYAGIGILAYFFFFSPGPGTPPTEIVNYNIINQGFYHLKVSIKDYISSLFSDSVADIKGKGPASIDSSNPSPLSSAGPSTPLVSNYNRINDNLIRINSTPTLNQLKIYEDKSVQTILDGITISRNSSSVTIIKNAFTPDELSQLLNYVNKINKITD